MPVRSNKKAYDLSLFTVEEVILVLEGAGKNRVRMELTEKDKKQLMKWLKELVALRKFEHAVTEARRYLPN